MIKQQQASDQHRNISWLRLSIVFIAVLFFLTGALLWILNVGHVIQGNWADVLPILFAVFGVIFTLCQWLLPISSSDSQPPQSQPISQQSVFGISPANQLHTAASSKQYPYDIALSYAGEDHNFADALAKALQSRGVKVFYDKYEKATLWGKNLYTYLSDLYQHKARFCVTFLSQHYANKLWTNHEREAAQARAFHEHEEYILPIRLDETEIPGILATVDYLSWPPENAETIADIIVQKLMRQ